MYTFLATSSPPHPCFPAGSCGPFDPVRWSLIEQVSLSHAPTFVRVSSLPLCVCPSHSLLVQSLNFSMMFCGSHDPTLVPCVPASHAGLFLGPHRCVHPRSQPLQQTHVMDTWIWALVAGLSPCARACTTCYHSSLAHASCGPRSTAPTISTCIPCGPGVGMPVILWVLFYCMSFILCHSLDFIFSCFPTNFNSCAPNGSGKVMVSACRITMSCSVITVVQE